MPEDGGYERCILFLHRSLTLRPTADMSSQPSPQHRSGHEHTRSDTAAIPEEDGSGRATLCSGASSSINADSADSASRFVPYRL